MDREAVVKRLQEGIEKFLFAEVPDEIPDAQVAVLFNIAPEMVQLLRANGALSFDSMINYQLIMKAAKGSEKAINEVYNRMMGRPDQHVKVTGKSYIDYLDEIAEAEKEQQALPNPDG